MAGGELVGHPGSVVDPFRLALKQYGQKLLQVFGGNELSAQVAHDFGVLIEVDQILQVVLIEWTQLEPLSGEGDHLDLGFEALRAAGA